MDSTGVEVTKTAGVTGLGAWSFSLSGNDVVMYLTIALLALQIISILRKMYKDRG